MRAVDTRRLATGIDNTGRGTGAPDGRAGMERKGVARCSV